MAQNNFLDWIDKLGGPDKTAKILKVTGHAVRVWVRGSSSPKTTTMLKIVACSKGRISIQDILALRAPLSFTASKKKK